MCVALLVLSLLGVQMALAQAGAATVVFADRASVYAGEQVNISVFYYDPSSRWSPLPGAEVLVGERTFITDADGRLTLTLDEPGTYDIVATKDGFATSDKFTLRVLSMPSDKPTPERKLQSPRMLEMGGTIQQDIPHEQESFSHTTPAQPLSTPAFGAVASFMALLITVLRRM